MNASSSLTNSSIVELTADVNSTVEQLRELGEQLKSNGQTFTDHDLAHIDEVIAALRELDGKRHKAHELLETETIKASVLRHRLANFPHKLKAELNALISSARETNAAEMRRLQAELKQMNEEADQAEKTQEVLELHNQVLEPEQTSLKAKYTDMVKKLNTCMGKKSKMQIKLNETRDKLNNTNIQIEQLEAGMVKLEQEMVLAREKFVQERGQLTQKTNETNIKCDEKKVEVLKLRKQLEQLQAEVVETALVVSDKKKALTDLEVSIRKLMALEDELKRKIETGKQQSAVLEQTCTKTEQETVKMRDDYATKKDDMLERTRLFKKELESEAVENKKLLGQKKTLRRDHKHAQEGSAMQSRVLRDMQENVGASKRTLLYQAEEGARLEAENKDLSFRTAQLKESHAVNVQLLKDEITDLKMTKDKEKKTREVVEETYNALQAQIETLRAEHVASMSSMATNTSDSDRHYSEMCEKATRLEREVKELSVTTNMLTKQLNTATAKLHTMKTSLTEQINGLEQNIADMTDEITDRNETLAEIEPVCKSLESEFKDKDDWYEARKRDIIALKSKRSELEDEIKRIERDLEKIHLPQEKFRMDSLRCRAYTRQRLRERVGEVETMEKRVVEARQQLIAITNENERIEKASDGLRREIENLQALFDGRNEIEQQLDEALRMYRGQLTEQWKENDKMEKEASTRDKVLLNDLSKLKNISEERLETITNLHGNFDEEVQKFTDYLETAAKVDTSHPVRTVQKAKTNRLHTIQ